ncbi:hypothetical protein F4805DRAFT_474180 [Annulohypoxylon moriforme]|nr:hypothetical protein F4805DRAFT_474180 [Annulohypoxylon moriforme]
MARKHTKKALRKREVEEARSNARASFAAEDEAANFDESDSEGWETEQSIDFDLDEGKVPPLGKNAKAKIADLTAHFSKISESSKNAMLIFNRRFRGTQKKSRKSVKRTYPPVPMRRCRELARQLGPIGGQSLSQVEERELLAQWARDPLKKKLQEDPSALGDMLAMWKIFPRLFSCFPTSIISRRNHLQYGETFETDDGVDVEEPNWSKNFCRSFTNLAFYPALHLQPSLLTLALIYAVICRTDYRGRIPWRNDTTDGFLDLLLEGMQVQDGSKSVVQVHREVLGRLKRDGRIVTSFMSPFFRHVEEFGFHESKEAPFQPEEPPIFEISTQDLTTLIRAADSVKQAGVWVFMPVSVVSRMVKVFRNDKKGPSDLEDLNELREAVILNDRRCDIVDGRQAAEPESDDFPPHDSQGDVSHNDDDQDEPLPALPKPQQPQPTPAGPSLKRRQEGGQEPPQKRPRRPRSIKEGLLNTSFSESRDKDIIKAEETDFNSLPPVDKSQLKNVPIRELLGSDRSLIVGKVGASQPPLYLPDAPYYIGSTISNIPDRYEDYNEDEEDEDED